MPPLFLRRAATVYSMRQLEGGVAAKLEAAATAPAPAPDKEVLEVGSAMLPLYTFPACDDFASKRIRSFGDLSDGAALPAVPDVDDAG